VFRGSHATELLVAAVSHLRLFELLAAGPVSAEKLRDKLGLAQRSMAVLTTALRAMGLMTLDGQGRLAATGVALEHLTPGAEFEVDSYLGLAADSPGVLEMLQRLRTNRPAASHAGDPGAAFIFREGLESAMDAEASARRLTLALAGRAKNVAPVLAQRVDLGGARKMLDVAGGTGIYAYAMLRRFPELRAVVLDGPQVLKVAREMAQRYGVLERTEFVAADMFRDPLPRDCDVILLSNVLHDWDVSECRTLVRRCAQALPSGGRLLIHDVFLNDALDGPLPIALYSAALFTLTEGRAYSAAEYRAWCHEAGLRAGEVTSTLVHCGIMTGMK
jgi:ubiquinone/menaquinone biosynthesis C-methylase UbiE/DNA-binding transcriptional ArsR family regulator